MKSAAMTALAARGLTRAALGGTVKLFTLSLALGQRSATTATYSHSFQRRRLFENWSVISKPCPQPRPAGQKRKNDHWGRNLVLQERWMMSTMLCQPMLSTPDVVVLSHAGVRKTNRL